LDFTNVSLNTIIISIADGNERREKLFQDDKVEKREISV